MSADPGRIGRYDILGVLGRGAMGVIYRAHDPAIDRPVAIKLIRADLLDGGDRADYLARFQREAQAAGRCTHPNIVAIYDFALHDGNPFLAMEYVDGINLTQARDRGAVFQAADAVFVILQALDALAAMHDRGIVHRDMKPANILLVGGTLVKVTDFGISRIDASELTHDGSVVGTPSYMSPEQCRGDPVDGRTDLFSTGAVLYELLCGQRPFAGRGYTEVTQRLLHEEPPPIRQLNPAISPALASVTSRALAKSPQDRFADAREMAAALRTATVAEPDASADRTIIVPHATVARHPDPGTDFASRSMRGRLDATVLDALERDLARHVGPIARYLVQTGASNAESVEALCASLAGHIERPAERDAFRAEAVRQLRRSGADEPVRPVIAPQELERARAALARHMGPIAQTLVRRSAAVAVSSDDLWRLLAAHIELESERSAFLSAGRKGPS